MRVCSCSCCVNAWTRAHMLQQRRKARRVLLLQILNARREPRDQRVDRRKLVDVRMRVRGATCFRRRRPQAQRAQLRFFAVEHRSRPIPRHTVSGRSGRGRVQAWASAEVVVGACRSACVRINITKCACSASGWVNSGVPPVFDNQNKLAWQVRPQLCTFRGHHSKVASGITGSAVHHQRACKQLRP